MPNFNYLVERGTKEEKIAKINEAIERIKQIVLVTTRQEEYKDDCLNTLDDLKNSL